MQVDAGVVVDALLERDGRVAVTLRLGSTAEVVVDRILSLTAPAGAEGQ